jgi:hypothetical protein
MPSSLVEVSFISNPREEKLLATDPYRQSLARSIAEGIHKYFTSQSLQHVALDDRENVRSKAQTKPVNYLQSREVR